MKVTFHAETRRHWQACWQKTSVSKKHFFDQSSKMVQYTYTLQCQLDWYKVGIKLAAVRRQKARRQGVNKQPGSNFYIFLDTKATCPFSIHVIYHPWYFKVSYMGTLQTAYYLVQKSCSIEYSTNCYFFKSIINDVSHLFPDPRWVSTLIPMDLVLKPALPKLLDF